MTSTLSEVGDTATVGIDSLAEVRCAVEVVEDQSQQSKRSQKANGISGSILSLVVVWTKNFRVATQKVNSPFCWNTSRNNKVKILSTTIKKNNDTDNHYQVPWVN